MATRVGGEPGVFIPPPGLGDNRLDQRREQMLKELVDLQLVHSRNEGEHILDSVVRSLRPPTQGGGQPAGGGLKVAPIEPPDPKKGAEGPRPDAGRPPDAARPDAGRAATSDLPKLVADFQRNNGLPVTGKLDPSTVNVMKDRGVIAPLPPPSTKPAEGPTPGQRPPVEAAPPKTAPRPEDTAAARQVRNAADQQVRARVDGKPAPTTPKKEGAPGKTATGRELQGARDAAARPPPEAERVVDPSRLLLSLVSAGFTGKKGNLEDGLKSFQATFGLPISGKLDPKTQEALASQGHVEAEAPPKTTSDKPVEPKQQVRRALSESVTSKTAADKDIARDPVRPQASTKQATTSSEVAARAPSTAESAAADKARLDTVTATQAATERGVQEATGDPNATQGHGEVSGAGAGHSGAGGAQGGGTLQGSGPGAVADVSDDDSVGEETATANAKAGDDNFLDEARGNANVRGEGEGEGGEFWRVPSLSEQVRAALEKIARDDDGSGPVTYTWDITFFRPGVYSAGQPAEEIWHVAVTQATAFDPVWQQAADAIASRMLYAEPDGTAPTLDDFILALRRARVR